MIDDNENISLQTAYRKMADHLDAVASIRRGLDQARKGEGRLAKDVLDELNCWRPEE